MLENRPGLRDRLEALGAFTAIGIGAVAGLEMVIGAGFDPLMPGDELRQVAPSTYVQVVEGFWSDARVIPLSSTEPYFMGDDYYEYAGADEALAGGYADTAAPRYYSDARDTADLNAEIEALYIATADFARDTAYDSSWRNGGGDRYVDEMNVADDMGDSGYAANGYADAYASYRADDDDVLKTPPNAEELQAVEPSASATASPL